MFFLLLHPEPLAIDDISKAVRLSHKTVSRSIKRLAATGILERKESGIKKWVFVISLTLQPEEKTSDPSPDDNGNFDDRLKRIENLMETVINTISTPKEAKAMPEMVQSEPQMTHIEPVLPQSIPAYAPQVEPLNIAKQAAMLLNNSLLSSVQEFKELFGADVPPGSDMIAVDTMIRRQKEGTLKINKSPLGYLKSISGLIAPPTAVPTVTPTPAGRPIPEMVDMKMIEISRIADEMWNKMGDGERKPFFDIGSRVKESRYKAPIETLARSEFKRQILQQHGVTI
jgi:DNA-binding Lrp family transcriptional regulator